MRDNLGTQYRLTLTLLVVAVIMMVGYYWFGNNKADYVKNLFPADISSNLSSTLIISDLDSGKDMYNSPNLLDDLVVVSGLSANHYNESLDMIGSVHHFLPNTPLIIYDLGLREDQVIELRSMKNVEVQNHNFEAYPDFRDKGYIGLGCYAWKPQVVREVSRRHMMVVWLDASIRLIKPLTYDGCLESVNKFSFVAPLTHLTQFRAAQFVRDSTLRYFNYTREQLKNVIGFQSGFLIFKMDEVGRSLMDKWFRCSLDHNCTCGGDLITRHRDKCDFDIGKNHSLYIGCHRYDQSTLTLICAKQFGIEHADEVIRRNCSQVFRVSRFPTSDSRQYIIKKDNHDFF